MSYDFADRLIELRKAKDLSQEELAKRLGVSRQAISKWERAESTPDIANLLALADLYDTTLDDLVRGTNHEDPAAHEHPEEAEASTRSVGKTAPAPSENDPHLSSNQFPPPPEDAEPVRPYVPADSPSASAATSNPSPVASATASNPSAAASVAASAIPASVQASESQSTTQLENNPLLTFPYPVFVALVYLILGFCFGLWHPGWIIFLTIPFYYWIINVIKHDPEYIARHTVPKQ